LYYDEDLVDYEKINAQIQELYKLTLTDKRYLDLKEEKLKKLREIEAGTEVVELSPAEIAFIVSEFQRYSLQTTYDVLSIFFETIIREEFKQTTGLYFTPINIVKFVVYGLELDKLASETLKITKNCLPYVIDPACGSGTFLIEAMKLITKTILEDKSAITVTESIADFIKENFDEEGKRHLWAQEFLYGMDNHPHLALTTKVNMVMNGDGHVHVYADDSLDDFNEYEDLMRITSKKNFYNGELNEQFDIVISNPPFSMKIDTVTKEKYREHFPILGNQSSEMLFLERWYQLLKPKGRLGVVLPESIFDTTDNMDVRLFLMKHFWIKAIISLPNGMKKGAFAPYTGTATSLLFAQKKDEIDVERWSRLWEKYSYEFLALKKKIEAHFGKIRKRYGRERQRTLANFSRSEKTEVITILRRFLRDNFDDTDVKLDYELLIKKYWIEVSFVSKNWWVFGEVVKELEKDYPEWQTRRFITHTDMIGYKRTKIRYYTTENKLFRTDKIGRIILDLDNPKSILEYMRKVVKWE
jgi:type I restriction enzyme M protein